MIVQVGTVRLRVSEFLARAVMDGARTDTAIAERIGVTRPTVTRALDGEPISGGFVAAVLLAFPDREFGDLFEAVRSSAESSAA